MTIFSRNRKRSLRRQRKGSSSTRKSSFLPRMEGLEERIVLSTMSVVNTDDNGPGSLRQAILDANAQEGADVIQFASVLAGTIGLTSGQLAITDELTIDGPGADVLTVSGSGMSRVFLVEGTTVTIDDITIADGLATDYGVPESPELAYIAAGGGLANFSGNVTLNNVHVTGNSTQNAVGGGAGVANGFGASLTVNHSTFSDNQAFGLVIGAGGAISADVNSTLTVSESTFSGNRAIAATGFNPEVTFSGLGAGGAIWGGNGSTATITDSKFENNIAKGGDGVEGTGQSAGFSIGGAIDFGSGSLLGDAPATLTVSGSTFSGNQAIGGKGADGPEGVPGGNGGPGFSGAIHVSGGTSGGSHATVVGSEFVGNQAIGGDGGNGGAGADGGESGNYNNVFVGNGSGAMTIDGGTLTVMDSTFSDNLVQGGHGGQGGSGGNGGDSNQGVGGAIRVGAWSGVVPGSLELTNTTLTNNKVVAGQGGKAGEGGAHDGSDGDASVGGLHAHSALGTEGLINVSITDSTVSGNVVQGSSNANTNGVGILADIGASLTLTNVTTNDNKQVIDGVETVVDGYSCEGIRTADGCMAAQQGDADRDGDVDFDDFMALAAAFGQEGDWLNGDFDRDGTVGFVDFLLLAQNYSDAPTP